MEFTRRKFAIGSGAVFTGAVALHSLPLGSPNPSPGDCPDREMHDPVSYDEADRDFRIGMELNEWAFLVTDREQVDRLRPGSGGGRLDMGEEGREFLWGIDFEKKYALALRLLGSGSGSGSLRILGIDSEGPSRINVYTCHHDTGVDDSLIHLTTVAVVSKHTGAPDTVTVTSHSTGNQDTERRTRKNASVDQILSVD